MPPATCALTVPFTPSMPEYDLKVGVAFCISAAVAGRLLCTQASDFTPNMQMVHMEANTQLSFTPCYADPNPVQISFWVDGQTQGQAVPRSIHIKSSLNLFPPLGGPSRLSLFLAAAGALVVAAIVVIALDKD